jgi:hypothetical protein
MSQISVQVIWKNGAFLKPCQGLQSVNCAVFTDSPRYAWLFRNPYYRGAGDEQYQLTFTNPKSVNAISGVFVSEAGIGKLLDAALNGVTDINAVVNSCNVCCGSSAVVAGKYNGTYPGYVDPLAKTYTVTRTDDSSMLAQEKFELDYLLLISGTLLKTGYANGQSTYAFQAYTDPVPVLTDTIVETPRVFTSNTAPSLSGSNVFQASGVADGQAYNVKGTTSLAGTVTALTADTIASTLGTWSISGSTIVLTTTTVDYATIVLGQEAP